MQPHRLGSALKLVLQLILSILIYIFALPFFLIWRLLLYLLFPTSLHAPFLATYTHTWMSLKSLSLMTPLIRYHTRIIALTLLLLQTFLSLALLVKSGFLFIPWLASHIPYNPSSKSESHAAWLNNLLLHSTAFLASCAPFFSLMGTGVGVLYYVRKVWVYGRFQKTMVRKTGGRGYYMPEKKRKVEEGGGKTVLESMAGALQNLVHPHAVQVQVRSEDEGIGDAVAQKDVSPYGYSEEIIFQQPGDVAAVQQEQPVVVVQKPEPVARFGSNPYTWHGVMSIWSANKSGYDGRDLRRRNFEDDIDMEDWSSREKV
ncbi:hypothetical protein GMOD_00002392 [Pyrenophora seminiperda CCB06]|uniref:Uncharacterized protein n=1 Tax=Pyrenophora seminiperda CCB06 TaxID=1302712 RepID=A0A3M7LXT5_9PLEO|nr:hypothetical protein GMOD_00002392 [Pyrenophora seminiperda CCB06]